MERCPDHRRRAGTLQALLLAGALAVVCSGADAADPFVTTDNPFQSGWKSLSGTAPARGLYSDGQTVVAWGDQGFSVSRDQGFTWSSPIVPSSGPVGLPGSSPVPVADAVVASGTIYVRTVDGAVRGGDSIPRNPGWSIGAVTRIGVDGAGTLYAEQSDGAKTIVIAHDVPAGSAPGRLVGTFAQAAVTWDGATAYRVDQAGASRPIGISSSDRRPPGAMAPSSGPGTGILRDAAGGSWSLGDELICTGRLRTELLMLSYGAGSIPVRNADAVGLARTASGLEVVVNAGGAYGNALAPILRDPPADLTAVCLVTIDEHGSNRFRLLGATPAGIVMYRSP